MITIYPYDPEPPIGSIVEIGALLRLRRDNDGQWYCAIVQHSRICGRKTQHLGRNYKDFFDYLLTVKLIRYGHDERELLWREPT